ncbi:hypothetical protein LLAPH_281_0029 [Lactococcus phage ASCC281]|uniref:Uncharacterized protein n=7 Tax=Skunavirus TaxID=1623305 RepID=H9EEQ0_9CAUD|nr:hypothetical protein LLAPH_532_0028 [Lactococcus phage ASCC532]YP_006201960.1 hypothetical protein LLAPH_281_0029 [Lactococcus phage ASCC281]AFE86936.1 hypothetical protein LLAPH_284_0028 [Lactococcus phage ASCC284]AFE87051.1 hypothetical protein LLAPH_310_0028 [Lactococcus phage ASCC310]AFE87222.1 hypothetical protein LLAPH_356_0028 [Lactococcus phage ASCC356]AFE87277.1 hypothetical protein LLAPH_358_0029 [Lactococcus phage ASCC358]AFE87334.1 hypothetical protein LLAPH_365_0029 [Lactococc
MKNEFIYYKAYYFSDDFQAFKSRKFYNKKEAIEWFESLPEKQRIELKKITEITEIIA